MNQNQRKAQRHLQRASQLLYGSSLQDHSFGGSHPCRDDYFPDDTGDYSTFPYIQYQYQSWSLGQYKGVKHGILKVSGWELDGKEPIYHVKIVKDERHFSLGTFELPLSSLPAEWESADWEKNEVIGHTYLNWAGAFRVHDLKRMQDRFIRDTHPYAMERRMRDSAHYDTLANVESRYPKPYICFVYDIVYDKGLIAGHKLLGNGLLKIVEDRENNVHLSVQYGDPKTAGTIVTLEKDQLNRLRDHNEATETMIKVVQSPKYGLSWHGYLSWKDLDRMVAQTDIGTSRQGKTSVWNHGGGGQVVD